MKAPDEVTDKSAAAHVAGWLTKHWGWVLVGWIVLTVSLKTVAPNWDDIAADGDLAFLPPSVPSAVGRKAMEEAFPGTSTRSQLVVVLANESEQLSSGDLALGLDLSRRLHWLAGKNAWREIQENSELLMPRPMLQQAGTIPESAPSQRESVLGEILEANLSQVIEIEKSLGRFYANKELNRPFQYLPESFQIRGELYQLLGDQEASAFDFEMAKLVEEQIAEQAELKPIVQEEWSYSVRDTWSWRNSFLGHKLGSRSKRARLISIQLNSEVTAVRNIELVNKLEALIAQLREDYASVTSKDLAVEISGSAAVGADMLRAAQNGVQKTEIVTIVLVLGILIFVYRSPLLVLIPLVSIGVSLLVAESVIALLARDPSDPTSFGIGVFTTTRIFVVVLLFGAGTDFCLFLIARCRELLSAAHPAAEQPADQVAKAWCSVHKALIASALTTIVGLLMMWFSSFEKFQFSGPIIAICLFITLLVCLSFTPALLAALGRAAYWPQNRTRVESISHESNSGASSGLINGYWAKLATLVVRRPQICLFSTMLVIAVPAWYGFVCMSRVTYDLSEELSSTAPSRRGTKLIANHFEIQDSSPISILVTRPNAFADDTELQQSCTRLAGALYTAGVSSVRSLTDPLGDYPPGKKIGLFDSDGWRKRMHRIAREKYISATEGFEQRVAKFDVLLEENPFSIAATLKLAELQTLLDEEVQSENSPWHRAVYSVSGTTVGITDLRSVTQADQRRIQILVTLGVWFVLIFMLRHFVLSTYLILTVLFSYFATLGVTYFLFSNVYHEAYSGLDWKVPIFLFVILVAVGQDYNVYLVTRIFEESKSQPLRSAVRLAVQRTGGIITSCGFVMAGTFIAMTSPAILLWLDPWLPSYWVDDQIPVLRGLTELGFALAFGVLLDTLLVRSILVPSFVVLWSKASSDVEATGKP
ncbi:MAG: MMPL family transporter [Planctomycetota bacterium]